MSSTPTSEGGGSEQKNAEIWSTRLQRELLAMTTDNASPEAKEEVAAILPSFCTIKDHALDIERGNCTVTCVIDLPPAAKKNKPVSPKTKGEEPKDDTTTKSEETDDDDAKEKTEVTEKTEKEVAEESPVTAESMDPIVVTMDVSLQKKPDGSINTSAVSYPFMKPVAILTSGSARFPEGSTIRDGDIVDIELDWTPSLHLTDALLNVALKVKECISQGEPIHPGTVEKTKPDINLNAMVNQAKKLGTSFSQSLRGLADVASKGSSDSPDKSKTNRIGIGRKKKEKKPRPKATAGEVRIGDEIHMLEAPWVDCQGVYSCKSIRRPKFVEEAMAVAKQHMQADTESQVANAGLAGAGAMFRSFATSARGVLEESFLMITESHIIEMKSNKLNLSTGIVSFAIPIEMLAKLKFRRQESISLFFKPAPDDPLIYMCPDSADCVHQIQTVLKRHGVKGKHTNAATHRAINQALHLVQEIQTKELALKHDPSVERVNEIMDLYRQAAERFEVAGDARHSEVVTHMRKFLALPLTVGILDGSYKKPAGDAPIATTSGEGVVLSTPTEVDDKATGGSRSREDDKTFERTMEDILKEAEADLANIAVEEDPELDAMLEEEKGPFGGDADDAIADFENMLKEADDELAELMNM
ncbi:hypothetical protein IV203_013223 [Nitzschia inconspicua]|uniref:Uncharacterized protein n=1 Tax=Nitzschia inconspicua TaxID=303405 RepID=A0A9K3Q7W7_9STRA|nr:hypothetical protein IV203_013223 [Nitzschia inconspicua]